MTTSDVLVFIADIISAVVLVVTVISLSLSLSLTRKGLDLTREQIEQNNKQLQQSHQIQKATFFKELYLTMFGDQDIRDALYLLDKDEFVYGNSFRKSDDEKRIDRLLSFADLVCALSMWGLLEDQEMQFFRYELMVIYNDPHVQAYLQYLKEAFKTETKADLQPFSSFTAYCQKTASPNVVGKYTQQPDPQAGGCVWSITPGKKPSEISWLRKEYSARCYEP